MLKDHVKDEKTGFLVPGPLCPHPRLEAAQKDMFLVKYSEVFNLSKAAKLVQTTRSLIALHIKEDKAFREAVENIKEEILDEIEESLYKQSKKSPIAAMQFLRAKRANEWGTKKAVEAPDKTSDKLKKLLDESE